MTPEFLQTYPAMTQPIHLRYAREEVRASLIMRAVADMHRVHPSQIMGPFRDRASSAARRAAMRQVRDDLGWSTLKIGKFFDRHHATVCHALGMLARNKPVQ